MGFVITQNLENIFIAIAILIGAFNWKHLKCNHKSILALEVAGLTANMILYITMLKSINNLFVIKVFTQVEFITIMLFFYFTLKDYINKRAFLGISGTILTSLFVITFFYDTNSLLDSISSSIMSTVFIAISIYTIYKFSFSNKPWVVPSNAVLIIYGILIYFSITFFFYLFSDLINSASTALFSQLWFYNNFTALSIHSLIAIALWKTRTQPD